MRQHSVLSERKMVEQRQEDIDSSKLACGRVGGADRLESQPEEIELACRRPTLSLPL